MMIELLINSDTSKLQALRKLSDLYLEYKYLKVKVYPGAKSSLDQKALFHVWVREIVAAIEGKSVKSVTVAEIEGTKRALKLMCYSNAGWSFMVHRVRNIFTNESKLDAKSIAELTRGEQFQFMEWLQATMADKYGLILESKGDYKTLKGGNNEC